MAFLGSLLLSRPAMFFLIRALMAGEDASRTETWNGLWRYGAFRSTLRSITAIWGGFYFAGLLIELALTRVLTVDTVVTIGPLHEHRLDPTADRVHPAGACRRCGGGSSVVEHLTWPL